MTAHNAHVNHETSDLVDEREISIVNNQPPAQCSDKSSPLKYELIVLLLSVGIIVAACFLRVDSSSMVVLPYLEVQSPRTCPLKIASDLDCPGCGLSRAMIFIAHGQFATAWQMNPAAFLIMLVFLYQIPLRLYRIYLIKKGHHFNSFLLPVWLAWSVVIALILQWMVRMFID